MTVFGADKFGPARVPDDAALGEEAAPNRYAQHGGEVRTWVFRENILRDMAGPRRTLAQAPSLRDAAKARIPQIQNRIERLVATVLPAKVKAVDDQEEPVVAARAALEHARERWRSLRRSERGYYDSVWIVWAVEILVVFFDAFVIHGALEKTGVSQAGLWGTTLTVPGAIWAANHSLGVLAGAIGMRVQQSRLRLGAVAFVSGAGALLVAFVTLAIFRDASAQAQNDALKAIAQGEPSTLEFFLSPLWMGPLQVAGSVAAISAVALWTIAKPGREQQTRVNEALEDLAECEGEYERAVSELREVERHIEAAYDALEAAEVAVYEIDARGAAADAEIDNLEAIFDAQQEQEAALAATVQARYEAELTWVKKIYENGGVWRCAMPTHERLFRRVRSRGPLDRAGAPPVEPSQNGEGPHEQVDPRAFKPTI